MALLLLGGIWALSREAASVSGPAAGKGQYVIVVDAGHGGVDSGMEGIGGIREKEINLAVARKLRDALEQKGCRVVMTREEDRELSEEEDGARHAQDLQNRCRIIEEAEPDLAVSIHQNSYPDPSVSGPQVFYYRTSEAGRMLAETLQETLNRELPVEKGREARGNDSYYLLRRTEGTVVIVECGFLTNEREAALLQEADYQQKTADAICSGILRYLSEKGADPGGENPLVERGQDLL